MTQNPNLGGIYSHNDEMVTGIDAALAENGNTAPEGQPGHVYVVGIGGTPNALRPLKCGTESISIVQNPFDQGRLIVDDTYRFITAQSVPAVTLVQPCTVDKTTLDCGHLWGNRGGKP